MHAHVRRSAGALDPNVGLHRAMRRSGSIQEWNDDRGFGFITAADGGARTFVHATSFVNRNRRPSGGDLVSYKLSADREGRPRAIEVRFVGERSVFANRSLPIALAAGISGAFMVLIAALVILEVMPILLLGVYSIASTIAFVAYWLDKSAARASRWRTSENTLLTIGLLGGWPGSLVAMAFFRHKSSKASFQSMFWASVVANIAVLGWLMTPSGSVALAHVVDALSGLRGR